MIQAGINGNRYDNMNPKMNPKVKPKTIKRYVKLWRWWTEKVDKKCKKVDRKFRMIPKMTVKVTPKMTPKRQRMKLSVIEANFWNDSMVFNKQQLWKRKNKMVYHTHESPTFHFFWEAKRECFGTSQKLLVKGRRI